MQRNLGPGGILAAMMALIAIGLVTASVRAERLSEMYVPTSGRLEMMVALGVRIDNLQIRTLDDVIALRDKLNEGPLDEKTVTSWKFLERAGLKKQAAPVPPVPAGAIQAEPFDLYAWRTATLNFRNELVEFETATPNTGYSSRAVIGPKSAVRVCRHNRDEFYDHTWHLSPWDETLSCMSIFSRDRNVFRFGGTIRPYADHELFVETFIGREVLLVDRQQDAVFAYAKCADVEQLRGISQFTIHLQLKPDASPQPHQIPTLTLRFRGSHCDCYLIKRAEFDIDIPDERFVVDVPPGVSYTAVGSRYPIRSAKESLDITAKSPEEVAEQRKGN